MEIGMKAFPREKLAELKLSADRFTFEPEITAKASRARWRIYEVPISYSSRTYDEGKKSASTTRFTGDRGNRMNIGSWTDHALREEPPDLAILSRRW
jgi:hypothetical protein